MANASKNKGKAYERVVAKHLSEETDLNFERVPNSGAFIGGKNIARADKLTKEQIDIFEGDIITPIEWDHIRIECKWYKDFRWHQLFRPEGESILNSWIEQAEQGTRPFWFLCFKINNQGEYIVFDSKLDEYLNHPSNQFRYHSNHHSNWYTIVSMELFFKMNRVKIIELKQLNNLGVLNDSNNRNE